MNTKYYVFVYGSLKKGYENSHYLTNSKFIGNAISANPEFQMYSVHEGYPALTKGDEFVKGEIYEINDEKLKDLDRLEGYPNYYNRDVFQFFCDGKRINAFVYYFKNERDYSSWIDFYLKKESPRISRHLNTAEWLKR